MARKKLARVSTPLIDIPSESAPALAQEPASNSVPLAALSAAPTPAPPSLASAPSSPGLEHPAAD